MFNQAFVLFFLLLLKCDMLLLSFGHHVFFLILSVHTVSCKVILMLTYVN